MDKTSLRLRKLWSPHAESVVLTWSPFTHTRRVSPHASSIHAHAEGLLALRAMLSLLFQYIFATLDAKIFFCVQAPPSSGRESDVRRPRQWVKRKLMVIISKKSAFYREVTFKAKEYIQKYKYLKIIKSLLHDLLHLQFLNI